jgi:hypothetical protein
MFCAQASELVDRHEFQSSYADRNETWGSRGSTESMSALRNAMSNHGEISVRPLGVSPPLASHVIADANANPPPDESPIR